MEHRYLTDNELNKIHVEKDMLIGNINRMCVSDDVDELINMYLYANHRIQTIFDICMHKFINKEIRDNDNSI